VLAGAWWHWRARSPSGAPTGVGRRRHWHPRTPDDCPCCRGTALDRVPGAAIAPSVRPWVEVKSRRGAPKRQPTAGYACPTPTCPYFGITDARIHALIAYGQHGTQERIPDLRCQACGTKFTARRGTALYRLKTPSSRVGVVLSALAEGLDVGAAVRVFGYRETTVTRWLIRAGQHAERLHQALFHDLHLPHVQLDEIRTRLRARARVLWLWVAFDPLSKVIPVLHLGPRTQDAAHQVVHALRVILPPDGVPAVTSDGLRLYYYALTYALTAHFGRWVRCGRRRVWQVTDALLYGQVQKVYRRRCLVRVHHRMRCGTFGDLRTVLQSLGLSGRLNTAFVERVNLTLRQSVAALSRRTWSTARRTPRLLVEVAWWRAYYHFVRPHRSLRVALPTPQARGGGRQAQRYRVRTPAMAAGLTTRRWSPVELLAMPGSPST
jgi:IS1 family transposase/transposase-like protein